MAEVTIDTSTSNPTPMCKRLNKFWWNGEEEPWYGDVCCLRAGEYIYAYGHAKDNPWVYLTRVDVEHATTLDAYEYWNGEQWQQERLCSTDFNEKQSVFWQINQGQIYWSRFHNCFIFIYCDNWWSCQILMFGANITAFIYWTTLVAPMSLRRPFGIMEFRVHNVSPLLTAA